MAKFGEKPDIASILKQESDKIKVELEKNTKSVNGKKFKIKLLSADIGMDVLEHIIKIITPSIGAALDGMRLDPIIHGAPTTMGDAALLLSSKLDGSTLSGLSEVLFSGMTVDGKEIDYRDYFKGNYGEWYQLFRFALEENFNTVFTESGLFDQLSQIKDLVLTQPQPQS